MKILRIAAAAVCAALLLTACGDEIGAPPEKTTAPPVDTAPVREDYPVSFGDESFDSAPATVASLSPSLTEILFEIGVSDRLVGVSDYCDYPEAAENLAKLGSPAKPDIDAIADLAPELLVTQSPIAETDLLRLRQAGTRVLNFEQPATFAMLCDEYLKLSMIFYGVNDCGDVYTSAVSGLDGALTSAQNLGISKTFVIVEAVSGEGLMLSTSKSLSAGLLSVFGYNLWSESESFYASAEELYELAPDVVFCGSDIDREDIRKHFPYADIIKLDLERFERPSARLEEVISSCADELSQ